VSFTIKKAYRHLNARNLISQCLNLFEQLISLVDEPLHVGFRPCHGVSP
jgi:hypothetical protein